jgi:ornithine cyclodeaminase/alanine dehydrogenase-like protein (mu-crystallin family)
MNQVLSARFAVSTPHQPTRSKPRIQASYLLFDADSLSLVAVLDGTALTALRTFC